MSHMEEYKTMRLRLIGAFMETPEKFITPADVIKTGLIADEAHDDENRIIMLAAQRLLKITPKAFQAALEKFARETAKREKAESAEAFRAKQAEERRQQAQERAAAMPGGHTDTFGDMRPCTAREAVAMFCKAQNVTVDFGHSCKVDGRVSEAPIDARIMLTAEGMGLTFGDGKCMSVGGIRLAWDEWVSDQRELRRMAVWEQISRNDPVLAAKALRQLRDLCDKLFLEPAFADAAIRKFIWQVKRRMQGSYIEHLHCLVFGGGQGTGKTELAIALLSPIAELCAHASMDQVTDDRNFTLKSMFGVFIDEMARADRDDINKMKTVITQRETSSRRLYTNTAVKIPVKLSLLGTADRRLNKIITDIAGMRRFIEVMTIPKHLATRFNWVDEVENFPWLHLWQAVAPDTVDPLMSVFAVELAEKQEDMRGKDNVEAWLDSFEPDVKPLRQIAKTIQSKFIEIGAEHLYSKSFRPYEDQFHPGSTATSLTSWGNSMKAMIEGNKLPLWSWRKVGNKVLYRLEATNVWVMPTRSTVKDVALSD